MDKVSANSIEISSQPTSAPTTNRRRPELLAPAGDWDCARAAVENGADAIYFGLERFNARMRAQNFTAADLPRLMEFLHRRGVRGYVTFNTLVFPDELVEAQSYLRAIISAGVDAAIVQDVGICRMIRALSPDFPIHASTQMTITSAAGIEFAQELGCNLVVLARECSVAEIEKIQVAQTSSHEAPKMTMPLEVFVHGALCVAYSGQCLTSESLGGRSANRGECAQACRMPYELLSDGQQIPLGDRRYLLSPQDLSGLDVLSELLASGVSSLKIEGRLKTPEYVANITRVYRNAIDRLSSGITEGTTPQDKYDLEMGFSRGLYTGWFRGINNQELAHARFGKKRGVYLGRVRRVGSDVVEINLESSLKAGDGVVFDAGRPDEKEEGGRVYSTTEANVGHDRVATLRFMPNSVNFDRVQSDNLVWKTSDPELDKRIRNTFAGDKVRFQRPLDLEVHGVEGEPLTLLARDAEGHTTISKSEMPLVKAESQPLDEPRLRDQLGRLGGTPFRLRKLANYLEGKVLLPVSELNKLRRSVVDELDRQRVQPKKWILRDTIPEVGLRWKLSPKQEISTGAELIVLVRSMEQLDAALACGVSTLYCEFEDPKRYREAVAKVHSSTDCQQIGRTLWVAPPRITKMGEEWILDQVRSSNADGYLVRNYDHLRFFGDSRRVGDFSLNIANGLASEFFLERFKLERLTASYDLNAQQLEALLRTSDASRLEITIHQHMPMFHMEHCVFCAFLSKGTDFRSCGRPCDKHTVKLRDRVGAEHPLKADAGCRNTVFNSQAQTGAEYASRFLALGVRYFRIEFLLESAEEVARTVTQYRKLLRGEITGAALWRELKLINQLGVTRGQMANRT